MIQEVHKLMSLSPNFDKKRLNTFLVNAYCSGRGGLLTCSSMAVVRIRLKDVSGAIAERRRGQGLEEDPLISFRRSGYPQQIEAGRKAHRKELGIVAGGSYA